MIASVPTILVVDDEVQNRKLVELLLRPEGYNIQTAVDGEAALAAIAQQAPDLILLDIMMPGINGYQLAKRLKADPATADIPIIMVTALADRPSRLKGLEAGAEEFLTKPLERAELCLRVRNMLRIKAYGDFLKNHSVILEQQVQARSAELLQFRSAMDSTADAIMMVNRSTMRFVEVNATACEMLGYTREELFSIGPAQLAAVELPELERAYDGIIAGQLVEEELTQLTFRRKDGSQFPAEVNRHALLSGTDWVIVGIVSDITERKAAEDSIRRLNRVHAMLSGITTLMVRTKQRDDLVREACRIAIVHGGYVMAWIGAVDREAGIVRPIASAGEVGDFFDVSSLSISETPPDSFGPVGRAVRDMKPKFHSDSTSGLRRRMQPYFLARGIRSLAVIPLLAGGQAVGVLALYAAEPVAFDEQEMLLLQELADGIAFAMAGIESAAKLERITRVNAMLSEINGAIVRIRDRQSLFEEVCRIAVETGGLPFAFLCIVEEAEMRLRAVATAGRDDGFLEKTRARHSLRDDAPEGHGIAAKSVREKRTVIVNDTETHPDIAYRGKFTERGILSAAALPLIIAGKAVGTLGLHAAEVDFFDGDELKLLTEVTANIAFALEHLQGEAKVRRLTRVYAVLSGINTLIVRTRDRGELFEEACRIAVEAGGFKLCWLGQVDPTTTQLKIAAWQGGDRAYMDQIPLGLGEDGEGVGLAARAVREAKPVIVEDIQSDPRITLDAEALKRNLHSLVILPLIVSDSVVGVLALYASEIGFFNDDEMRLLTELAGDIAFAMDNIQKQERLDYLAYYDPLTGLANRTLFLERMSQYMRGAASASHKLAVLLVDVERFKSINDSLGRPSGDALLMQMAKWLILKTGDAGLLARVGADHFALMLPQAQGESDVAQFVNETVTAFMKHPFRIDEGVFRLAVKIGVALFPEDGADADTLFRNAEAALKRAKKRGERYLFHTQQMTESVAAKLSMENKLRQALDRGEFMLHYQPKGNLNSGRLSGAEALIRWNDPRTGLTPPGLFIPILEETGLIHDVGRWALRQAIADHLRWRAAGLQAVRIAVNVSPLQLRDRGFIDELRQIIGVDPHAAAGLELEITESVLMEDVKHSITTLEAIRKMGIVLAIDDFGTGFSSLSHLARLPVDTLKIDRSFVTSMTSGPQGLALVSTIINLAHSLKLKVVAEGVETDEQSRLLRLLGCDEMQGYLFSKPVACDLFEASFLLPGGAADRIPAALPQPEAA